jgi:hypothetical protein
MKQPLLGMLIVGFNRVWTLIVHNAMRIVALRPYAILVLVNAAEQPIRGNGITEADPGAGAQILKKLSISPAAKASMRNL